MSVKEDSLSAQTLRGIPELKYVNADNVVRYRAIMRFFIWNTSGCATG